MADWLQRARTEIPETPSRPTANSDVRSPNVPETALTSLLAGSHLGPVAKITTTHQDREVRAHIARVFGDHPEAGEALAVALASPEAALDALRLAEDSEAWAIGMGATP